MNKAVDNIKKYESEKLLTREDKEPTVWTLFNPRFQETFLARNEINYRDLRRELAQEWEV